MTEMIVVETRRSKGVHKADLTKFSKEQVGEILNFYKSNSYVAVRNYRAKSEDAAVMEIKFHKMGGKGTVKYSLKTTLSSEDLKALGFKETPNKNLHLTTTGNSLDAYFDIEVKEPVKKISSKKKEKAEAKEAADTSKKTPLAHPKSKAVEVDTDDSEVDEIEEVTPKKKTALK